MLETVLRLLGRAPKKRVSALCYEVDMRISANPDRVQQERTILAAYIPSYEHNLVSTNFYDELPARLAADTRTDTSLEGGQVKLYWESDSVKWRPQGKPYIFEMVFWVVTFELPCNVVLGRYTTWGVMEEFPNPLYDATQAGHLKARDSWTKKIAQRTNSWAHEHPKENSQRRVKNSPTALKLMHEQSLDAYDFLSYPEKKLLQHVAAPVVTVTRSTPISTNTIEENPVKDSIASKPSASRTIIPSPHNEIQIQLFGVADEGFGVSRPTEGCAGELSVPQTLLANKRNSSEADSSATSVVRGTFDASSESAPNSSPVLTESTWDRCYLHHTWPPQVEEIEEIKPHFVNASKRREDEAITVSSPNVLGLDSLKPERRKSRELDPLGVSLGRAGEEMELASEPLRKPPGWPQGNSSEPLHNWESSVERHEAIAYGMSNLPGSSAEDSSKEHFSAPENETRVFPPGKNLEHQQDSKPSKRRKKRKKSSHRIGGAEIIPRVADEELDLAKVKADGYWTLDETVNLYFHVDSDTQSMIWYEDTDSDE